MEKSIAPVDMIHVLPIGIPTHGQTQKKNFPFSSSPFCTAYIYFPSPFPPPLSLCQICRFYRENGRGGKGKSSREKREREMGGSSESVAWGLFPLPLLPSALVLRNPRCRKRSGKGSEAEDVHCQERRGAHGSVEGWGGGGGGDADAAIGRKRPRDESERGRRFRKKKGKRPR